eukprot:6799594-Pyramimonas_sp.AAC.1
MKQIVEPEAKVDLWRKPSAKDQSGWRGPAEMVRCMSRENKAIIIWRGHPMLVPLRHIRPHIGFVWLLQPDTKTGHNSKHFMSSLMDQ